jgi:hypothetical protein
LVYFKNPARIIATHVSHIKMSRTLLYRVHIMEREKLHYLRSAPFGLV